jgi:hypothetical protein
VKATTHITITGAVFAASTVGFFVLLFLVPDRLSETDPPLTASERGFWLVGALLALPAVPLNLLIEWLQPPGLDWRWILVCNLLSGLFWSLIVAGVRHFWSGRGTEPGASPNGGPADPLGNSGAWSGPPSVS